MVKHKYSYIVHLLGVGHSQNHVHSVSLACKLESTGMLAVASLIQRSFSSFGFLNIHRPDGDPASTSIVVVVI